MPPQLLTTAFIIVAPLGNHFDTKVRGLCLRVFPSGRRSWAFVYRARGGGPMRWLRLGDLDSLTLAKARDLASSYRYQVDVERRDPLAERQAATAAPAVFTFQDMAKVYIAFQQGRKKRTWKGDEQKIAKHLTPVWGTRPLKDLTRTDVHELLDRLVAQGMTVGVNRIQALISRIFTVALDRSLIDSHPVARMIKRFDEAPGERVLSDEEIRTLWAGLEAYGGDGADVLRLRLLLGQRGGETLDMTWLELDLDAGVWRLPGGRTKNSRPHAVPLPPTALWILRRRAEAAAPGAVRVFPKKALVDEALSALAVGYEWTDLRRTVATRLGDLGFNDTAIGRVLNHAASTVTQKHYNWALYWPEKLAALSAWDEELQRIIANEPRQARKVLAFGGS